MHTLTERRAAEAAAQLERARRQRRRGIRVTAGGTIIDQHGQPELLERARRHFCRLCICTHTPDCEGCS